jgi:hypothetical protein
MAQVSAASERCDLPRYERVASGARVAVAGDVESLPRGRVELGKGGSEVEER